MRRLAWWVIVVLLLGAAAILWRAPATLVSARVARLTDGRIALGDSEGTVWQGNGVVAIGDTRVPVAWRLHPAPLLRGEVGLSLGPTAGGTEPRAELLVAQTGTRVRDLALTLPADAIVPLLVPRPRLVAGGIIAFRSPQLAWPPDQTTGSIDMDWREASLGLAGGQAVALGDVSVALVETQGRLSGPLRNRGGEFALEGELTIGADGGGEVRGIVRPRDPNDARFRALAAIGRPVPGGVALEWRWPGR